MGYLGGEEQIRTYCHNLATDVGTYLSRAWNTSLLVPNEMSGFMINIILPSENKTSIKAMQETLYEQYGIYIVHGAVNITDNKCDDICNSRTVYITRLSAQVYLALDDFKPLGRLVPQLLLDLDRAPVMPDEVDTTAGNLPRLEER